MIRDFIRAAGGPVPFVLGGLGCAVWMLYLLALPQFVALAFGVTP